MARGAYSQSWLSEKALSYETFQRKQPALSLDGKKKL